MPIVVSNVGIAAIYRAAEVRERQCEVILPGWETSRFDIDSNLDEIEDVNVVPLGSTVIACDLPPNLAGSWAQ